MCRSEERYCEIFWGILGGWLIVAVCLNAGFFVPAGIYLSIPNHRRARIDEYNAAVVAWETTHRQAMQAFDGARLATSAGSVQRVTSSRDEGLPLRKWWKDDEDDNPKAMRDYNSSYFVARSTIPGLTRFQTEESSSGTGSVSFGFNTSSLESFSLSSKLFMMGEDELNVEECLREGGHFDRDIRPWHDVANCFWLYYLRGFCVLVDPATGRPTYVDENAPRGQAPGCYRSMGFLEESDEADFELKYTAATYHRAESADDSWEPYVIRFAFRSPKDPVVLFYQITDGLGTFGDPHSENRSTGWTVLIVGAVLSTIWCLILIVVVGGFIGVACKEGSSAGTCDDCCYCPCPVRRDEDPGSSDDDEEGRSSGDGEDDLDFGVKRSDTDFELLATEMGWDS